MENKVLFQGIVSLQDGTRLSGPVTTKDNDRFVFTNRFTDLDYWLVLQKVNGNWRKVDGLSFDIPMEQIIQLAAQIDAYLTEEAWSLKPNS